MGNSFISVVAEILHSFCSGQGCGQLLELCLEGGGGGQLLQLGGGGLEGLKLGLYLLDHQQYSEKEGDGRSRPSPRISLYITL